MQFFLKWQKKNNQNKIKNVSLSISHILIHLKSNLQTLSHKNCILVVHVCVCVREHTYYIQTLNILFNDVDDDHDCLLLLLLLQLACTAGTKMNDMTLQYLLCTHRHTHTYNVPTYPYSR